MERLFVLVGDRTAVLTIDGRPKIVYTRAIDHGAELERARQLFPGLKAAGGFTELDSFTYPYGMQAPARTAVELVVDGELGSDIFAAEVTG